MTLAVLINVNKNLEVQNYGSMFFSKMLILKVLDIQKFLEDLSVQNQVLIGEYFVVVISWQFQGSVTWTG